MTIRSRQRLRSLLSLEEQPTRQLVQITNTLRGFSISPEGKSLDFTEKPSMNYLWVLENFLAVKP